MSPSRARQEHCPEKMRENDYHKPVPFATCLTRRHRRSCSSKACSECNRRYACARCLEPHATTLSACSRESRVLSPHSSPKVTKPAQWTCLAYSGVSDAGVRRKPAAHAHEKTKAIPHKHTPVTTGNLLGGASSPCQLHVAQNDGGAERTRPGGVSKVHLRSAHGRGRSVSIRQRDNVKGSRVVSQGSLYQGRGESS